MMNPDERRKWRAEFEQLGANSVRASVVTGKWPKEKRNEARQWLERKDIDNWQKTSATAAGGLSGLRKKVGAKWVSTAVGLIFGLIAVARLLKRF